MPLNLITASDAVFLAAIVCGSLVFSVGLLVLTLRIHARIANTRQLRAAWSRLDRSQPRPDSASASAAQANDRCSMASSGLIRLRRTPQRQLV